MGSDLSYLYAGVATEYCLNLENFFQPPRRLPARMRRTPTRRTLLAGLGAAAATTAAGAGSIVATDRATASADDDESARLRVAHASPDAPDVDVLVDGDTVLSGVSFRSVTGYLSLEPAEYEMIITAADDPETVAFEGTVSVEAGTDYTVAAIGELSEDTLRPELLIDEADLDAGTAGVRVLHASPDAPAVDVTTAEDGSTLVDDLPFGETTGVAGIDPGRYTLEVRPASSGNDNPFDAEFGVRLLPGRLYTLVATGYFTADDEPSDSQFTLVPAVTETRRGD
jgi:hypothetical protein